MATRSYLRVGAALGIVLCLGAWLLYRPSVPESLRPIPTVGTTPSDVTLVPGDPPAAPVRQVPQPDAAIAPRRPTARVVVHGGWGDAPGTFGRAEAHESNPEVPMALCVSSSGEVIVLDQVNLRLQRFRQGVLVGTTALPSASAQDVIALPQGRTAVLDRLGAHDVALFDADGRAMTALPLIVGPVTEAGGVTGIFTDSSGIYAEWAHDLLVRLADANGNPNVDHTLLQGRPSRDGSAVLRAAIADRANGAVSVQSMARTPDGATWSQTARVGATVLSLVLLDSDADGRVVLGADVGTPATDPPYAVVDERVVVMRYTRDGTPDGTITLPPLPPANEIFRPLAVADDGTILAMEPGPSGLSVVAYGFSM